MAMRVALQSVWCGGRTLKAAITLPFSHPASRFICAAVAFILAVLSLFLCKTRRMIIRHRALCTRFKNIIDAAIEGVNITDRTSRIRSGAALAVP